MAMAPGQLPPKLFSIAPAIASLMGGLMGLPIAAIAQTPNRPIPVDGTAVECPYPAAVLNRLTAHTVRPGDSIESVAATYGLLPATILAFNELARDGRIEPGDRLQLPPFDGIRTRPERGTTWRDLATTYGLRANVLYELNGCTATPSEVVFIPGIIWSPTGDAGTVPSARDEDNDLTTYPLPELAAIALGYGWNVEANRDRPRFNSSVVLETAPGAIVRAAGPGTVAFAGVQEGYGNLVVINHQGGRQTRYGNLGTIAVQAGQRIPAGHSLGILAAERPDSPRAFLTFEVRYSSPLGWVAQNPLPYLRLAQPSGNGPREIAPD
jgi:murein DD-endopeptidase MepM/ murein hydrolase activator NlpD